MASMWTGLAGVLLLFLSTPDGDNMLQECCVTSQSHVFGLYNWCVTTIVVTHQAIGHY